MNIEYLLANMTSRSGWVWTGQDTHICDIYEICDISDICNIYDIYDIFDIYDIWTIAYKQQ